ncbi:hypothetical protein KKE26_11030 [bacterium]|nr:hypothetical protein [bacterium]MBU1754464.1 hypothetical protein [bacterium]
MNPFTFMLLFLLIANPSLAMTDTTTTPDKIEIGVFDPSGRTTNLIEAIGRQSIQISDLNTFDGKLLIIGPNSLDTDMMALLKNMVRHGTNILCLKQEILPSEGLSGLQPVYGTFTITETIAYSQNHPVLSGVDKWNRCGTMTNIILSMPDKGNFRPIIASKDEVLLMEIPYGQGEFVFCQLDVFEQETNAEGTASARGATSVLFKNMIDYCLNYKGKMITPAVYAHPKSKTMEILNSISVPGPRNPLKFDNFSLALVCLDEKLIRLMSILNKDFSCQLREFVHNGGRAIILNLTPQTISLVKEIFSEGIGLKEAATDRDAASPAMVPDDPLLWGIDISGLYPDRYILTNISGAASSKQDGAMQILAEHEIISRLLIGNGDVITCQFNLENNPAGVRALLQILTNMGVMLP